MQRYSCFHRIFFILFFLKVFKWLILLQRWYLSKNSSNRWWLEPVEDILVSHYHQIINQTSSILNRQNLKPSLCENPRALYNSHTQTFSKKTWQIDHRDSYVSYLAIISVNRAFTDAPSIVIDLSRKSIILEWKTGFKWVSARSILKVNDTLLYFTLWTRRILFASYVSVWNLRVLFNCNFYLDLWREGYNKGIIQGRQ